jgi:serine/threonine protein kinase
MARSEGGSIMNSALACDEDLVRRLPLPLAQLYRRAHNAKTPLERHLTAFYLWEAALKLLAATAIVEYAERGSHDPQLDERLTNLARPSLGHWWEFVRRLVPVLADHGDEGFGKVRDLVLGRTRDDLPRAAGLDAALREALAGQGSARTTVRLTELLDRLVQYRNQELGHGAAGQRSGDFYEAMGRALLAGVAEVLGRLDVLAGRRLVYIAEVRQVAGNWLVQRYELVGESARRIESLDLPRAEAARLPDAERVYLDGPAGLRSLHPLLIHDAEAEEVLFLNARRGRQRIEYLSYTTGRLVDRPDLGTEQRALLARVLAMPVDEGQAAQWAARSQAEEPAVEVAAGPARRQLGEFELLSELGRGGMGKVYRAWQPSLGRQVALKELLRTGDAKAEARFAREIRALGRVEHPHLVKIFTSGSEGDHWFYAMELIEGASLAAVCDKLQTRTASVTEVNLKTWQEMLGQVCEESRKAEKPLGDTTTDGIAPPPPAPADVPGPARSSPVAGRGYVGQVVALVRQVAEAAHALHEAGIIHRDIKPGNIMVTVGEAQAVLMDLGLAQLADDLEGRLTRTRQFVGTLRYASPEQVLAVGRLDRRSDVYSLGATLWELLTLRPIYGATEQMPTPELMQRIQYEEPERVRKHHRGIARDLEAIVSKCLQKNPARRYGTADELAEDLRRFQANEPITARPVGQLERASKWARRRPALAGLLAVSVVAVLALGGFAAYFIPTLAEQNRRLAGEVARAEEAEQAAGQRATEANAARVEAQTQRDKARDLARQEADARKQADEEKGKAKDLARREADARKQADEEKGKTEEQRDRAERLVYAGQLRLAQAAWQDNRADIAKDLVEGCQWNLRGWEHRYLNTLFNHLGQRTFFGHAGEVTSVCFSPDGKHLATASYDRTVRVWDVTTGKQILTLKGHTLGVNSVCFSPDGKRLASASGDRISPDRRGEVIVWDAATGQEVLTLKKGHTLGLSCVCFSPDGKRLASSSWDETVKVWDAATGEEILTLKGHKRHYGGVVLRVLQSRRQAPGLCLWVPSDCRDDGGAQGRGEGVGRGDRPGGLHPQAARQQGTWRVLQPRRQTSRHRQLGQHGEGLGLDRRTRGSLPQRAYSSGEQRVLQPRRQTLGFG